MENSHVGFIGLGRMGEALAANLHAASVPLFVFDAREEAVEPLLTCGAAIVRNPAELAEKVKLLFLCLPFAPEVGEVLFSKNGVATGGQPDLSIVDTTTTYCSDASYFQDRLKKFSMKYSDCPVSGMSFRAENGTLTMMFGGNNGAFECKRPCLDVMGEFIVYCGECGTGQMMKAFNKVIYDINIAGVCEILPMAIKAGLKPETLERVLTTASARSFAYEHFVPRLLDRRFDILDRRFDTDFAIEDAYKDIINVQQITTRLNASMPVVNAMVKVYEKSTGYGGST